MKIVTVKGFTLFELLLALGLSVILLMALIPAYRHFLARNKTTTIVNHIVTAIHAARSEAVAQNQVVAFCGSSDGVHCDGQWQRGQLILIDQTQQMLRIYGGLSAGDRLWWQSSLGRNNALKLAPSGFTAGQRGSFYYCPRDNAAQYGAKIIIADSSRVRVEADSQELQQICATSLET